MLRVTLALLLLAGCEAAPREPVARAQAQALGYAVDTNAPDMIAVDGVCSLREAWRAAANGIASADCPNGGDEADGYKLIALGAGTWTMALANPVPAAADDASAFGDLDMTGSLALKVRVRGAGVLSTVLDAANLDRIFHVKNLASLELSDLTLRNGCVNGGNCATGTPGSEPNGGLAYYNAAGTIRTPRTAWEDGRAREGGCLALCSTSSPDGVVEDAVFDDCTAQSGGAILGHVDAVLRRVTLTGNTATGTSGVGGAIKWYDRIVTVEDSTCTGNSASSAGGCWAAVGRWEASTAGHVDWFDGTLQGNTAGVRGGNVYVGPVGTQNQNLPATLGVPCSAGGCSGAINGVAVTGGTAPAGPDCSGVIDLWDGASVGSSSGCTTVPHDPPPPPVCGDGELDPGEQCDDGNAESCDGCSSACASEIPIYCAP